MKNPTFGFPSTTTITCVEASESGVEDACAAFCVQRLLLRPGRSGEQPCPLRCSEGRMAERRAGRTRQTLPVRMPWPVQHEQRDPHDARQRACLARTPCQRRRLLRLGELGQTNFRRFTDSRPAGSTCWVPVYACVKTERHVVDLKLHVACGSARGSPRPSQAQPEKATLASAARRRRARTARQARTRHACTCRPWRR